MKPEAEDTQKNFKQLKYMMGHGWTMGRVSTPYSPARFSTNLLKFFVQQSSPRSAKKIIIRIDELDDEQIEFLIQFDKDIYRMIEKPTDRHLKLFNMFHVI